MGTAGITCRADAETRGWEGRTPKYSYLATIDTSENSSPGLPLCGSTNRFISARIF